jgi:hypothetical protein
MKMMEVEVPDQVFEVQAGEVESTTIQQLLVLYQEEYNKLVNRKHRRITKTKLMMTVEMMMRKKMMI